MQCPLYLIKIIINFLKDRIIRVYIGNSCSEPFTMEQGVPQGSPISPLLYNIYCSDISRQLTVQHPMEAYTLLFADDTGLISHAGSLNAALSELQRLTNSTTSWFDKWRLTINADKSQLILFHHIINLNSPTLTIHNTTIHPKPLIKYLGVTFDNKMNFKNHIQQIKKSTIQKSKFFKCFDRKHVNLKTLSFIYKVICRPSLEYAHPIYVNAKPSTIKILKTAETCALRNITKMRHPENPLHNPPNRLLYQLTEVTPLETRLEGLWKNFINKQKNQDIITNFGNIRDPDKPARRVHPSHTILEALVNLIEN